MRNFYTVPVELRRIVMDLSMSCLLEKPDDYAVHCFKYFEKLRNTRYKDVHKPNKIDDTSYSSLAIRKRISVMVESYDPEMELGSEVFVTKTDKELEKLTKLVQNVFLFSSLNKSDLLKVANAMIPRSVKHGEVIIQQGSAQADYFYIVDEGFFQATIKSEKGYKNVVRTYDNCGSFGELALLYSVPRAATIKAITDGKLWEINKTLFIRIILKSAYDKRERLMSLIERVEFLKALDNNEKLDLADTLTEKLFLDGSVIFHQGDVADGMYFVDSGAVDCLVTYGDDDKVLVQTLGPNDYFGELSLLTHNNRALTVKAVGDTSLAFLKKSTFKCLLDPYTQVLKDKFKDYEAAMIKAVGTAAPVYSSNFRN